ncbi:MAG: carboxy-S-adenosyl-L-methionine synthase CmoA [Pseudohongiellaceae bacterium]
MDQTLLKTRKDRLFAHTSAPAEFVFDARVAEVFEDMIDRSVPGYRTIISMIGVLAGQYCRPGSTVYDLGCSLGAATMAIRAQVPHSQYRIVAVDNSAAMIARMAEAAEAPDKGPELQMICSDIMDIDVQNASVVVLNFTLQFIPVTQRDALLARICRGMNPGGILILSEKIVFPDPAVNQLFIDMYHRFKEEMGYSRLEISRKRTALENVLIPETIDDHRRRALAAGFCSCDTWFQCFNFTSMVAFKKG